MNWNKSSRTSSCMPIAIHSYVHNVFYCIKLYRMKYTQWQSVFSSANAGCETIKISKAQPSIRCTASESVFLEMLLAFKSNICSMRGGILDRRTLSYSLLLSLYLSTALYFSICVWLYIYFIAVEAVLWCLLLMQWRFQVNTQLKSEVMRMKDKMEYNKFSQWILLCVHLFIPEKYNEKNSTRFWYL